MKFRLDRTAFSIQPFEAQGKNREYWLSKTTDERLAAAWYLTKCAYGLDPEIEHRLDRTVFSMRKNG